MDKMRRQEDGSWVWKTDPVLFAPAARSGPAEELTARTWNSLSAITCPILEVRGSNSYFVSDEILGRMRQCNAGITVTEVEGAGHIVPVDNPQGFIAATRAFLAVPA